MSRYDKYKDSGIAWIGSIPTHWEVKPFKTIYRLGKGLSITKADLTKNGVAVINYGQIHSKLNIGTAIQDHLIKYVPDKYLKTDAKSLVFEGDVIFADTSEDLDGCGNCIYVDRSMNLFAGYHTIIARNTSGFINKYLPYLFKTDLWRGQLRTTVSGVKVLSISQKILATTTVTLPPLNEQQQIADFLDRKCAEIDELVALQEVMIGELKAYKQSVITEVVTRGLNPDAPLRDSGVKWIGEIPKHWECGRLKNIISERLKYGANENGITYSELLPRYVRITDIIENELKENIEKQSLAEDVAKDYILTNGDILFARSGGTVGKSFIYKSSDGRCAFAGYLIKASINSSNLPQYVYYYTKTDSYSEWKNRIFIQATIQNIGADKYSIMEIPLPPLPEQQAIADHLDRKCEEIDQLIAIKQEKIEQLKEYKKSVIFEYVTGKKRVQ